MTESAPETSPAGDAGTPAPKRFLFLRKKASADSTDDVAEPTGATAAPAAADGSGLDDAFTEERVRPGVLRRRRRQLLGAYEQGIFDLGGLAMEMHARGLLAEAVLRRRAAEVADLRAQVDDLGTRLDEIRQARQERRQAGRGAAVTCPACGARSRADANFCASCGAPLQAPPAVPAAEALGTDQPTTVIVDEQVTSVIIESPVAVEQTRVIPPRDDPGSAR